MCFWQPCDATCHQSRYLRPRNTPCAELAPKVLTSSTFRPWDRRRPSCTQAGDGQVLPVGSNHMKEGTNGCESDGASPRVWHKGLIARGSSADKPDQVPQRASCSEWSLGRAIVSHPFSNIGHPSWMVGPQLGLALYPERRRQQSASPSRVPGRALYSWVNPSRIAWGVSTTCTGPVHLALMVVEVGNVLHPGL